MATYSTTVQQVGATAYDGPSSEEQALIAEIENLEPNLRPYWLNEANEHAVWTVVGIEPYGRRSLITVRRPAYYLSNHAVGVNRLTTDAELVMYAAPRNHEFGRGDTVDITCTYRGFLWFKSVRDVMYHRPVSASPTSLTLARLEDARKLD